MGFLGCLLSLLLVGIFIILSFGLSIISAVLRFFGYKGGNSNRDDLSHPSSEEQQRQRVFDDDEGEYVDFEEV